MTTTQGFGQSAESEGERYLKRKGYQILERNYRSKLGELDIVAKKEGVVVFIEVKARRTDAYGGVAYAVTERKQERLIRMAAAYLSAHRLRDTRCRFDVLLCSGGVEHPIAIEHVEHAFEVPGDDHRW